MLRVESARAADGMDAAAVPEIDAPALSRLRAEHRRATAAGQGVFKLQLLPPTAARGWASAHALPLAADPAVPEELPALYLEEPELMVRFRRPATVEALRAYVLMKGDAMRYRLSLNFPDRGLSFPVPPEGVLDLPGVTESDLATAHIAIQLVELSGES